MKGFLKFISKDEVGSAIENDMMNVLEVINRSWCLVDFHAIQIVFEKIEWTNATAEECSCRFFVQHNQFHHLRFVIPAMLHDIVILHGQTSLQVWVCLEHSNKGVTQFFCIHTVELRHRWQVVLSGISVELPVNIHTTLVLRDGIIVQLVVGLGLFNLTSTSQWGHLTDSWM